MNAEKQASTGGRATVNPHDGALRQELDRKQQRLAFFEERHREISLEITLAEAELQELESGGLGGLLSRLKGNCQGRANDIAATLSQKDMERAAVDRELNSLRGEIAGLQNRLNPPPAPTNDPAAGAAPGASGAAPSATGDELRRRIERAVDAAHEARRDILSEVETTATMGRCKVAQGNKLLTGLMNASRNSTRRDCATRAQRAVARFMRKYNDVRLAEGGELDDGEQGVIAPLERYALEFEADWLRPDFNGETFALSVVDNIATAIMLLERRLKANPC